MEDLECVVCANFFFLPLPLAPLTLSQKRCPSLASRAPISNSWDSKNVETLAGPPLYCTTDCSCFFYRDNRVEARELTEEEKAELAKVGRAAAPSLRKKGEGGQHLSLFPRCRPPFTLALGPSGGREPEKVAGEEGLRSAARAGREDCAATPRRRPGQR